MRNTTPKIGDMEYRIGFYTVLAPNFSLMVHTSSNFCMRTPVAIKVHRVLLSIRVMLHIPYQSGLMQCSKPVHDMLYTHSKSGYCAYSNTMKPIVTMHGKSDGQ